MCDFINVSAVKKFVHSKDRRCSPEFLRALDATLRTAMAKACEARNGGAKTLDEGLLGAGCGKPVDSSGIKAAYDEVVCMGLQMRVMSQEEFQKRIRNIKSTLEPFLSAK